MLKGAIEPVFPEVGLRLAGRKILVVGAGQQPLPNDPDTIGNGRAICALLATEGAAIAAADRKADHLDATLDLVRKHARVAVPIIAEATEELQVERMIAEAVQGLGGLDGLVMNLGTGAGGGLAGTSVAVWDKVFAINARSHFLGCKHAMPVLTDGSSIVLISSVAALKPASRLPAYDASKAALAALGRHVALEGAARQIRTNIVLPGLIDTPLGRAASAGRPDRASTTIPLGRQGTAWEVAQAVAFLLSSQASYITGQSLAVDGGFSTLV